MRIISSAAVICLLLASSGNDALAGRPKKPVPARPTGVPTNVDPSDAYYGGPRSDTITESVNELGQTVYSVRASHFDVSRPLREMAIGTASAAPGEDEGEAPENPRVPSWRIVRSDVPDPVARPAVRPGETLSAAPLAAPTTGFNFQGVGIAGGTPSDSNGSVGNNQFVETVNVRYQVWSLNRSTMVATSVLGPASINTLWAGFGGACQNQNSGDPIVVFDKTARRWLISQFTSSASAGTYYQCVAVSTTADATGTYARWAFAIPGGRFGDYPHIGVWNNAYYMMAHGFGGTFAALFAAMDRQKMLAGNAAATWLVIADPNESGHMPADLDGFAQPPTSAPGIFVSLHSDGMYIYRMKVSFAGSGTASKTLQAIVPTAPANAACGGGTCIPQPGTGNVLDAISDRLMFRAAYRNFLDHESLVISHSVDPSVSGLVSGVRWYDIRLSGNADATCPVYPCMYQQGTIADTPGGRDRWMPSVAMDTAENMLVGYSTTGKTAGTENHSSRYTARAKGDPLGTMTAPETTIVTGIANNVGNSRWGDYASVSVDPQDDCTFWYVSQYYGATNAWSTQIASAAFPAGSGPGQCPVTTCTTRPGLQPTGLTTSTPGDNQITISWTGITPAAGAYAIERAVGACGTEGLYRPLAAVSGSTFSYTDTTVQGGSAYSYRVRSAGDAAGKCQAILASICVSTTATGSCNLQPAFGGATSAASSQQDTCGVTVSWAPGTSGCPLTPTLRYNIFRGTTPEFVPSPANRIASCVTGPSSYVDSDNLTSGTTYYYAVRAEDTTTGHGGECGDGNEEANGVVVSATPYAAGTQAGLATWTDGGGDTSAQLTLNAAGVGNTAEKAWRFVKAADDPGANHTPGGAYAYRNAGPSEGATYPANACNEIQTPALTAGSSSIALQYWERHQVEYHWDTIAVEYSVNGGAWNDVPAPSNSAAVGCSASDETSGWEPLGCTQGNGCGYPDTKMGINGPVAGGSTCDDFSTSGTVPPYAHRCHPITGLNPDDTVRFRWRASSDEGREFAGFYLDDVAVTNVHLPNACVPSTCLGHADGTACSDGNPCTTGDACSGEVCVGGAPVPTPPETQNMAAPDKTTVTWSAAAFADRYDVVRGSLGALPVGPGAGDEACFANLAAPTLSDPEAPATSAGFWYLSRGENACGGAGTYGVQHDGTARVTTTCP